MLFTRCPGCQTTFRITADTLRVANGAVRCGSCATVFSAFSGMQQNARDEDPQTDEELLSPTVQTRELAGIEELASPELEASSSAGRDNEPEEQPGDEPEPDEADPAPEEVEGEAPLIEAPVDGEAEDSDSEVPVVEALAEVAEDLPEDGGTEPLREPEANAALEPSTVEQQAELTAETSASESSDKLQFDVPTDDWTQLLSEIEQSAEESSDGEDEAGESDEESAAHDAGSDGEDFWNVGDPAATESWAEIEESGEADAGHERVAVGEAETAPDIEELVGDAQGESEVAAMLDAEPDISAEQVDATLSTDPDPELVEALEAGLASQDAGAKRPYLWTVGSVALLFMLAFQVIHHFRAPLASQSVVGPLVQGAYSAFGIELMPEWDLDQYEILNWVATEAGLGNLRITAQIRNNGPRTQPYPYIHLELKDRWEAVVGSRVFEPVEYLQTDTELDTLMAAGLTVPADFAVVDPGEDAYGFELDVCVQRNAGQLSCSSQRVFE